MFQKSNYSLSLNSSTHQYTFTSLFVTFFRSESMDKLVVLCFIYLVFCSLTNVLLTAIILRFATQRPLLQINIMDCVAADLLRSLSLATCVLAFIFGLSLLNVSLVSWLSNLLGWYTQFQMQITMIYVSWGVILRYIQVYAKRMILIEISEEKLQNVIRLISIGLSAILCGLLHMVLQSSNSDLHLVLNLQNQPRNGRDWGMLTILSMGFIGILINVILRWLIWKARKSLPRPLETTPTRPAPSLGYGLFLIVAFVTGTTAPVTIFGGEMTLRVASFYVVVIIPASLILCQRDLRRYAYEVIVDRVLYKLLALNRVFRLNKVEPKVSSDEGQA